MRTPIASSRWLVLALAAAAGAALAEGDASSASKCTSVDMPTSIALDDYLAAWPQLAPWVARLRQGQRDAVKAELKQLPDASDGALNLLAQLEREDGQLEESERLIDKAIALQPRQHLHYFQRALFCLARLSRSSGLGRWTWHGRTKDAYEKAFKLNPRPVPYRSYLVYSLIETPGFAGGDKDEALRLTQQAIDTGQKEFYVVRADVYRSREEDAKAFADYDRAIEARLFKQGAFRNAGDLALKRADWPRAKRYFEWAISCRPNAAWAHEGLGDSLAAMDQAKGAHAEYEAALRIDPGSASARTKLSKTTEAK
jgi:tetratricopeptide (TPR) repeat protein